ncbi:MAG TPA: hypothetical protein VLX90_14675 [Steroidobacteraceae bacterium]|nr:hypothetical protein [Steroidobacteraceae bacterium]
MHIDIDRQMQEVADRLRRLPTEVEPPYNWQEFRRRSRSGTEAALAPVWTYLAMAASLVAVIAGVIVWSQVERPVPLTAGAPAQAQSELNLAAGNSGSAPSSGSSNPLPASGNSDSIPGSGSSLATTASPATNTGADLARSRALEKWLASLPPEPVVVRVGTRAAVARLEDRIAQVDDLLTSVRLEGTRPDGLVALQAERARLVGSLAQVRYAEFVSDEAP